MSTLKSSEFRTIDSSFSGTFNNLSYKNIREHNSGYEFDNLGILKLLEIDVQNVDSVNLSFATDNSLVIKYSDSTGIRTENFKGQFSKKGFYEFYFRKKNIQIPPLLPVIYSRNITDRIRITLTLDNDLLIDDYTARSGNLLFFGGGGNSSSIYYFEPINK